jgi:hypothetical protein
VGGLRRGSQCTMRAGRCCHVVEKASTCCHIAHLVLSHLWYLCCLQENISSGRAQEGLTVYHEGGQMLPSSDAGQQVELLDRLGLGVKLLSGESCYKGQQQGSATV